MLPVTATTALLEVVVVTGHDEAGLAEMFTEAFWDERYRTRDHLWSGQPNATLVAEVSGLSPGRALDAGCGEGADSIWLAIQGWQVTGIDISTVALDRAAGHAAAAGPDIAGRVTWQQADLLDWAPGPDQFDLATAHYMHFPPGSRDEAFRRLAATVRPGGTLLIVGHHASDMGVVPRPPIPELFFSGDDIAVLLDLADWDVITNTAAERAATHPEHGHPVTLHDAVLRAQRHPKSEEG
jgi:SAM-dependent methyltransferase